MRYTYLLLWLLCGIHSALAQLNESDTARLQLRVSFSGNYQQGNVAVTTLRGKLDWVVRPKANWAIKTQNSSLYQAFYSRKADHDLFSRNYLYYRPQNRIYPFGIAYLSTNYRRKITYRYFAGIGLTGQLIRDMTSGLKLSAGAVYEHSHFSGESFNETRYNGNPTIRLWRATTWIAGWRTLLAGRLRLYYDAYYQPAFAFAFNNRWQVDVGLDVAVFRGLSFNTLYTYTHEQVVVTSIKPDDQILTFGLAYQVRKLR